MLDATINGRVVKVGWFLTRERQLLGGSVLAVRTVHTLHHITSKYAIIGAICLTLAAVTWHKENRAKMLTSAWAESEVWLALWSRIPPPGDWSAMIIDWMTGVLLVPGAGVGVGDGGSDG